MKTDRELMQQALEALKLIDEAMPFPVAKLTIKNLSERLAQPEREPDDIASILACRDMLDAQPVPPRTWVGSGDIENSNAYLTPPQRKPLTLVRIEEIFQEASGADDETVERFARGIEREIGFDKAELWIKRINDAVLAEREACAKMCDELFADIPAYSAPDCAAAIRARGDDAP